MKIEVTKERILEAASKCSQAKETLKTLFPEVFEEDKSVDCSSDAFATFSEDGYKQVFLLEKGASSAMICTARSYAPKGMQNKCFYLTDKYNWELRDVSGEKVLIPTRKND